MQLSARARQTAPQLRRSIGQTHIGLPHLTESQRRKQPTARVHEGVAVNFTSLIESCLEVPDDIGSATPRMALPAGAQLPLCCVPRRPGGRAISLKPKRGPRTFPPALPHKSKHTALWGIPYWRSASAALVPARGSNRCNPIAATSSRQAHEHSIGATNIVVFRNRVRD